MQNGVAVPLVNPIDLWYVSKNVLGSRLWVAGSVRELYDAYKS
jgi:hypothetical protein